MSLGLAIYNNKKNEIYLAIEGMNAHALPANSKMIKILDTPEIWILVTGYLEPWNDVLTCYDPQGKSSMKDVRNEIERLLGKCVPKFYESYPQKHENVGSYGLICGFEDKEPVCFRVECSKEKQFSPKSKSENLEELQVIGMHEDKACDKFRKVCKHSPFDQNTLAQILKELINEGKEHLGDPIRAHCIVK